MADGLNLDAERALFEAQLPSHWSREMAKDDEGDMVYVDDLTAGAFCGWRMARATPPAPSTAPSDELPRIKPWQERTEARDIRLPVFDAMRAEIIELRAALANKKGTPQ